MSKDVSYRIVGFELVLGSAAIFMWGMLTFSMGIPPNGVAVGAGVALLTAALLAGADRSRLGVWVLSAVGVFALIGVVLVGTEPWVIPLLPVSVLGMSVGWLLNRVVFGLVRPVPQTRVERGFGWTGFD
jgi:hypothetical protein